MTNVFTEINNALGEVKTLAGGDVPDLPALPDRYWERPTVIIEPTPGEIPDRSAQLEKLVDMSLNKAEELLSLPVDPLDDNYTKVASMQKDLVVSMVNAGLKVDENRFRKKSAAALVGILAQVLDKEKSLAIPATSI